MSRENARETTSVCLSPAQIVLAVGQIAEAFAGNLENRVADSGLDRSGTVVAHAEPRDPPISLDWRNRFASTVTDMEDVHRFTFDCKYDAVHMRFPSV